MRVLRGLTAWAAVAAAVSLLGGCGSEAAKAEREPPPDAESATTASPVDEPAGQPDYDGGWETDYGRLTFETEDTVFVGSYDGEDGTLTGTVDGPVVAGEWYEPDANQECDEERGGTTFWGTFRFVFAADGRSFEGSWGYCGAQEDRSWSGRLVEPG